MEEGRITSKKCLLGSLMDCLREVGNPHLTPTEFEADIVLKTECLTRVCTNETDLRADKSNDKILGSLGSE
jgi:hypothetical protein